MRATRVDREKAGEDMGRRWGPQTRETNPANTSTSDFWSPELGGSIPTV